MFQEAVSDIDGTLRLNLNEHGNNLGRHSVVWDYSGENILVQSSRLETVANRLNIDHIDLVKVDVEGAEPQVISGMRSLVDHGRVSRMVIEWNPKEWTTNSELLSWLFEAFHIYHINQLSLTRLTKMNKESLPLSQTNLYLVKK